MKTDISISATLKPLGKFFRRFHSIIFFLLVSAGLFIAILILLPITNLSTQESQTSGQTIDSTFDQATIDKLRSGTSSSPAYQPSGRTNPFNE